MQHLNPPGRRAATILATLAVLASALGAPASAETTDPTPTPSASAPAPTSEPSSAPTSDPTSAPTSAPTAAPTTSPTTSAPTAQAAAQPDYSRSVLDASPSQIAFGTRAGRQCTGGQAVSVVTWTGDDLPWTASADAPWISLSATSGPSPAQLTVTADCDELSAGVHTGQVTIRDDAPGVDQSQTVDVRVVVNPSGPVGISTWKDGHRGAFSSTTDDSYDSGYAELKAAGTKGTFVMNGSTPPASYPQMYADGMELGSHLLYHLCTLVSRTSLISHMTDSISAVAQATGSADEVQSLVWPCGFRNIEYGVIAADYFLSARGYNWNALEDTTPVDFMDLKSFNSHEHTPVPPADLKTIVDDAQSQGKWANLVLHGMTNDDGAIAYAATKDVWSAPIGTIVKYIHQRNRTVIDDVVDGQDALDFTIRRLPLPEVPQRDAEAFVKSRDTLTFTVDVTGVPHVSGVRVAGATVPFRIRTEGGTSTLYFSSPVTTTKQAVKILKSETVPPILEVDDAPLSFTSAQDGVAQERTLAVTNSGEGTLSWAAEVVSGSSWLSVTPESGTDDGSVTVRANPGSLAAGTYSGSVKLHASGAAGSPVIVPVSLTITPKGEKSYRLNYPDRAALLADGWDFKAKTAAGAVRDTERTSGTVVSYSASGLRVPVDTGDIWSSMNNSRNSLLRDLPSGWSRVELSIPSFAPTRNYQSAGIGVYDDDDNYVLLTRSFNVGQRVSLVNEVGGTAQIVQAQTATATSLRLRLTRSGNTITAAYSTNGGSSWIPAGSVSSTRAFSRLALLTGADAQTTSQPTALYDEVVVVADESTQPTTAPTTQPTTQPTTTPTTQPTTQPTTSPTTQPTTTPTTTPPTTPPTGGTFSLGYADRAAMIADGWDFRARTGAGLVRDTERTSGATASYSAQGLGLPTTSGDLWSTSNNSDNTVLRDLPSNWTSVRVRLTHAPSANYQHAGIVLYDNDDNYLELARSYHSTAGNQIVMAINETSGTPAAQAVSGVTATDLVLRFERNAATNQIVSSFSTDAGATWRTVSTVTRGFTAPRLALNAGGATGAQVTATFREATIQVPATVAPTEPTPSPTAPTPTPTPTAPTPTPTPTTPTPTPTPTAPAPTETTDTHVLDQTSRAGLLAAGWDFAARTAAGAVRNTESATATPSYAANGLGLATGQGDLWQAMNNTTNTVFRDLPSTWTSVTTTMSYAPTANYQHGGIVLYVDDDNYVELTRAYNSTAGAHTVALIDERSGTPVVQRVGTTATSLQLRFTRNAATGVITGSFSTDAGQNWREVGTVSRTLTNVRIGLNAGGAVSGSPVARFERVVVGRTTAG